MSGLHGVETIELTTGTVAVQTISTAVIGLVGTAPDASGGVCASGTAGSWLLGTALDFTAKQEGRVGNKISVVAVAATEQNAQTAASLKGTILTITLGTDEHSQVNATVDRVTEVVNALGDSPVTAAASTLNAGGAENKVVSPFSLTLSGGEDEAFPVNTPVVVAGAITQAGKLGTAGTLYPALRDIFDQTGALVIVVRAESKTKAKEAEQRAAVIQAMEALETYAAKLRAVAYIDSPSMATPQDVVQRRASFGGRVELLRPRVSVTDDSGQTVFRPYSARAAGLRARIDYEKGWWWSKSNQDVMNITGLEQVDTFILGEQNCTANLLNMENISTIIRHDGFKHWGNRLCTSHSQWRFEPVRRTADVIEDSIQEAMLPYVDRPLDRDVADDILGSINAYMRQLKNLGAIHGGSAWLNDELNTAETLAVGQLYIDYDFGPKSPLERLTLRAMINNKLALEELTV
ncbi:phage tail sheath subtilisin-like domain-containing protein [Escherichia coli]|nr:phage tail sheath subtilisin-like domain-containing protein [Escherichia coli]